MTNGARVGLQSGKQVAADIRRQEIMIKKKLMQLKPEEIGRDAETIYRDAKGKKIDMELENARLQAERQEEEMIEKARTERNKGMVQQELAQRRKEEFLRNKDGPMARYADDDEINNELKQKELWNDPAAKFLTKKKSKLRYPQYQGRAPPNRYNIPPGYRWDGRDRSNGFETKLFEKFNAQKYKLQEAHAWSTEDM
ncbi:hypothetical protein K502DRAFT_312523 [Neoconidiobolus thromboides FSU 785]|nr:hypothetical protein K502DRAFT_312523 [Neoconidiobolus thromboides FSU 785]